MIKREFYSTREDGVNLYITYSDNDLYVVQNETGIEYAGAIDVENSNYTYSESSNPIEERIKLPRTSYNLRRENLNG